MIKEHIRPKMTKISALIFHFCFLQSIFRRRLLELLPTHLRTGTRRWAARDTAAADSRSARRDFALMSSSLFMGMHTFQGLPPTSAGATLFFLQSAIFVSGDRRRFPIRLARLTAR